MLGTNSLPLLLNPLHFHTKFYILEGYNEYLYINILSSWMERKRIKTSYAEKKITHGTSHDASSFDHTASYQKKGKKREVTKDNTRTTGKAHHQLTRRILQPEPSEMPLSLHLILEGILLITIISAPNPTWTTGWRAWAGACCPNGNGQTPNMATFTPTSPNRNSQAKKINKRAKR